MLGISNSARRPAGKAPIGHPIGQNFDNPFQADLCLVRMTLMPVGRRHLKSKTLTKEQLRSYAESLQNPDD
ncbi:MAG TPA: hypothetical protein DCY53_06345 [Desulfobacteraceae bacterium]|nr:hypothetical protein [Desulfobacteraceae bacterium]